MKIGAGLKVGFVGRLQKIDMVVDWPELKKAGIDRKTAVIVNVAPKTLDEFLRGVVATIKPTKGIMMYKVAGGVVRVTAEGVDQAE